MAKLTMRLAAGAAALLALSGGVALTDGPLKDKSVKDAAPATDEGRKLTYSWNIGATSDYVFRGISQNGRHATPQGGVDVTYGIFYAGVWSSGVDFGQNPLPAGQAIAGTEVDLYAGIKPVWGPLTFDLGVIQYWYPAENAHGPRFGQARDNNYVEAKLGVSTTPITNLTTGVTLYLSPQYTGGQGSTQVLEGTAAYELAKIGQMVPTVGGTLGGVFGDSRSIKDPFTAANGKDQYMYWNAGLTLGLDKLSIDFRYWDTDIADNGRLVGRGFCHGNLPGNISTNGVFQCDSRYVVSAKVTF